MFCEKCGAAIQDNSTFCEHCGNRVTNTAPNTASQTESRKTPAIPQNEKKPQKKHPVWPCYLFSPILELLLLMAAFLITLIIGVQNLLSDSSINKMVSSIDVEEIPASLLFDNADEDDALVNYLAKYIDKYYYIDSKSALKKKLVKYSQTSKVKRFLSNQMSDYVAKLKNGTGVLKIDVDEVMDFLEKDSDNLSEVLEINIESSLDEIRIYLEDYNEDAPKVRELYSANNIDPNLINKISSKSSIVLMVIVGILLLIILIILNIHHIDVAFLNLWIGGIIYTGISFLLSFNVGDLISAYMPAAGGFTVWVTSLESIINLYLQNCCIISLLVTVICFFVWLAIRLIIKVMRKKKLKYTPA